MILFRQKLLIYTDVTTMPAYLIDVTYYVVDVLAIINQGLLDIESDRGFAIF